MFGSKKSTDECYINQQTLDICSCPILKTVMTELEQSVRPVRQVPDHFLGISIPQSKKNWS